MFTEKGIVRWERDPNLKLSTSFKLKEIKIAIKSSIGHGFCGVLFQFVSVYVQSLWFAFLVLLLVVCYFTKTIEKNNNPPDTGAWEKDSSTSQRNTTITNLHPATYSFSRLYFIVTLLWIVCQAFIYCINNKFPLDTEAISLHEYSYLMVNRMN